MKPKTNEQPLDKDAGEKIDEDKKTRDKVEWGLILMIFGIFAYLYYDYEPIVWILYLIILPFALLSLLLGYD